MSERLPKSTRPLFEAGLTSAVGASLAIAASDPPERARTELRSAVGTSLALAAIDLNRTTKVGRLLAWLKAVMRRIQR